MFLRKIIIITLGCAALKACCFTNPTYLDSGEVEFLDIKDGKDNMKLTVNNGIAEISSKIGTVQKVKIGTPKVDANTPKSCVLIQKVGQDTKLAFVAPKMTVQCPKDPQDFIFVKSVQESEHGFNQLVEAAAVSDDQIDKFKSVTASKIQVDGRPYKKVYFPKKGKPWWFLCDENGNLINQNIK